MTDQNTVSEQVVQAAPPPVANVPEQLSDVDRLTLELAKSVNLTARAEAKAAIAVGEKAELSYRYIVLQLYMKYGLTGEDAIKETGEIVRGGAVAAQG